MVISLIDELKEVTRKHYDPVLAVSHFVQDCRAKKMTFEETIEATEDKFNHMPLEADVIVRDFWDQPA